MTFVCCWSEFYDLRRIKSKVKKEKCNFGVFACLHYLPSFQAFCRRTTIERKPKMFHVWLWKCLNAIASSARTAKAPRRKQWPLAIKRSTIDLEGLKDAFKNAWNNGKMKTKSRLFGHFRQTMMKKKLRSEFRKTWESIISYRCPSAIQTQIWN